MTEEITYIRKDDSWFIQFLSAFFWIFGQREKWMTRFWVAGLPFTGRTIYVPRKRYGNMGTVEWELENMAIIQHEEIHMEQRERMGDIPFALAYLLWPPSRYRFEAEAYMINLWAVESPIFNPDPILAYRRVKPRIERIIDSLRTTYLCWIPSRDFMSQDMAARFKARWRE